jgi:pimeloyl-ACP methyl ester carboxylesterase
MIVREGVVLLHGHGRFGASMALLAKAARRAGYATLAPSYPYRRSLGEIAAWLAPRVAAFEKEFAGPLHIVTHSLGGLVARALIAAHRPQRLGRVVMLAPPNRGSELADLLIRLRLDRVALGAAGAHLRTGRAVADEVALGQVDYPLGIIAGDRALLPLSLGLLPRPHDGKVSIAATHVAGQADHVILPVTHTLMVYDRRVIGATLGFLKNGAFDGPSADGGST